MDKVHGKCDLPIVPPHSSANNRCKRKPKPAMAMAMAMAAERAGATFPPGGDSIERCNSLCSPLGYKYFGLQAGHACFCGNTYGSMGRAPSDSSCSKPCQANHMEICGGPDFNSIYETVPV